jgi:uncharacterized protein YegL
MKNLVWINILFIILILYNCKSLMGPKTASNDPGDDKAVYDGLEPDYDSGSTNKSKLKGAEAAAAEEKNDESGISEHESRSIEGELGYVKAPPSSSGLKAGYSDDNKQFNYFVGFLNKYGGKVNHIPLNISERIKIILTDSKRKSIANAGIKVFYDDIKLSSGKTYADGSFYFFPSQFGSKGKEFELKINCDGDEKEISVKRNDRRVIKIIWDKPRKLPKSIPLDIVFIFDTTGSMGEEIKRLKDTIEIIYLNLSSIKPKPLIRFGMVLYKDQKDEYVTRVVPLTKNLSDFQKELNKVTASGGGDGPEDLQSALNDTVHNLKWNTKGIRLGYIITDAPPHLDYNQKFNYIKSAKEAKEKGIKLFSVGTGGLNIMGEYVLRQISQFTSAKYIFLTYGEKGESEGGKVGSVSHHTGENFSTDKLESIVIRFTKEELVHLSNISLEEPDEHFRARKLTDEEKSVTLQKLFDRSVMQLINYSSLKLSKATPAAVVPIQSKIKGSIPSAEYFSQQLSLSLGKHDELTIVERGNDMKKVFKEMKLKMTGLIDEKTAAKLGKFIGAKILITGELFQRKTQYELFLKLVRVETSEVLSITKAIMDKGLGL